MTALRKPRPAPGIANGRIGQHAFLERLLADLPLAPDAADDEGVPILAFTDLQPDAGDEVVLRPGGFDRRFRILTPLLPVEQGRALPHVTAAGEDVTGMRYVRFPHGPAVYFPADVELEFVLVDP